MSPRSVLPPWLALAASLATLPALAQAPDAAAATPAAFARAHALQQAGDFAAAASAYEAFLSQHPDNVEARSNLGVVLARLGRTEEAIAAYRAALERSPSQQAIRLNLGLALYKAARFDDAAAEFAGVLAAQPMHLQARYLEADCRLRIGQPQAVIASLEPIAADRGGDRVLAYLLGMAYLRTHQVAQGQLWIDRLLADGESAEARLMLGLAKRGVQDLTGALADLERAVALNPDLPGVHALFGQLLLSTGNRDRARAELAAEFARNPSDFDANLLLGMLAKEDQDFETARAHLARALAIRPGDLAARFQEAAIQVSLGETDVARGNLEAIVREAPAFIEARVSLATVYYRLKLRDLGDRERAAVDQLNREAQARQPGAAPPRAQGPPPSGQPAFRTRTAAVVLDVVVRDRKGRAITDLRQDELTVLEDGEPVALQSFALVTGGSQANGAAGTGLVTGQPDPLRRVTLVTVVFDHLSQGARDVARKAALEYLAREQPAGQWVSTYRLDNRLTRTQAFTRSPAQIGAGILAATQAGARESADAAAGAGQAAAGEAATPAGGAAAAPDQFAVRAAAGEAAIAAVMERMASMVDRAQQEQRGQSSLYPLMALVKAHGALEGRKALLLFSEGLAVPPNLEDAFRTTVSEANRANVSVYAIDVRGLDPSRSLDGARLALDRSARNSQRQMTSRGNEPVTIEDVMNSENAEGALRADTQGTLRTLAEETGGLLVANANDVASRLARVSEDLDAYYEIAYTPRVATQDGRFRAVQVKVARRGVDVQSRSGYFALPATDGTPLLPYELPMLAAASATPMPHPFDFAATVFRFGPSARGVQHTVHVEVPLDALTFEEDRRAGRYTLRITAMALVSDERGSVVERLSDSFPLEGPLDRLPALRRGRLVFKRQVHLAPGRYTVVAVIRDQATERSSAQALEVEVPDARAAPLLSTLAVIRRVEQAADAPDPVEDPFRSERIRIVPSLDVPISLATNTQVSAYVVVYPQEGRTPALSFEFLREGDVVGRAAAEVPPPDEQGRVKYVATFPTAPFEPGHYRLRAVATLDGRTESSEAAMTIVP